MINFFSKVVPIDGLSHPPGQVTYAGVQYNTDCIFFCIFGLLRVFFFVLLSFLTLVLCFKQNSYNVFEGDRNNTKWGW